MKEIRHILILVIGVVLFSVAAGWILTDQPPPSDWTNVIPTITGNKSMNITTSTFKVASEKWEIVWWPRDSNPLDKCAIEIYNASTDMKLQEFILSTDWPEISTGSEDIRTTGSFYLKIQVYQSQLGALNGMPWTIRVREYKPQPPFHVWIALIIVIGIAIILVYLGYESYKFLSK